MFFLLKRKNYIVSKINSHFWEAELSKITNQSFVLLITESFKINHSFNSNCFFMKFNFVLFSSKTVDQVLQYTFIMVQEN